MLSRVFEMQHRGVLHVHPVLAHTSPGEVRGARRYLVHLAELAPGHGFGYVERRPRTMAAQAAAAYLSAYFVTGSNRKATLQESVRSDEMPRSIVHVATDLSMATGCTMRRLRMVRFLHVRGWDLCEGDTFHLVDRYEGHPNGTGIRRKREFPYAAP